MLEFDEIRAAYANMISAGAWVGSGPHGETNMSLDNTVEFLRSLRLENRCVEALPPALTPADLVAAYRVQAALVDGLCERWGGETVGYKVAVTNRAAQQMLGVHHPVFGRILSARVHRSGEMLLAEDYAIRLLECEFGFRIAEDVPALANRHDRESIARYVGALYPAIELVEHHFAGIDRVTPQSLAADNAIHGAWIHGDAVLDWRHVDLAVQPTRLLVNGEERLTGSGGNVLGHPLEVVAWLANELPQYGLRLARGDFVTTGVTTDGIYPAAAGDRVVADFPSLGRVEVSFD